MFLFPITSLGNLLESILLFMNALAILNDRHFLRHCSLQSPDGWHEPKTDPNAREGSFQYLKNQLVLTFHHLRKMGRSSRVSPVILILLNVFVILLELLMG